RAAVNQQPSAHSRSAAAPGRTATPLRQAVGDGQVVDGDDAVVDVEDAVQILPAQGQVDGRVPADRHVVVDHQELVQLDGGAGRQAEADLVGPRRHVRLRQAPAQVAGAAAADAAQVELAGGDGEGDVVVGGRVHRERGRGGAVLQCLD